MADLVRTLRGAYPGPSIEPDATVRAQLLTLGQTGVRYGGMGLTVTPPPPPGAGQWNFSQAAQSGQYLTVGL